MKKLDYEVKWARDHKEWRTEYMTLQMKLDEAREEGRLLEKRDTLLALLSDIGVIPSYLSEIIGVEEDLDILQNWIKIAARAKSVEMFLEEAEL